MWAVLAAQLSAPVPIDFIKWWSTDDMPAYHQINGITRWLKYRVTVSPDGSIQSCDVEVSSTDANLDNLTCNIIKKRGRLEPAKAAGGSPVYGVYRHSMTWAVGDSIGVRIPGDVTLKVEQFPKGIRSPAAVKVNFAVDEYGRISDCGSNPENEIPGLVTEACEPILAYYKPIPVGGRDGYAVRSIQNATVVFKK
jgi:hypothetical protein